MSPDLHPLAAFVARHPRLFLLTGAGISTPSGIPDYRDADGAWKHSPPVQFTPFMQEPAVRQRYWARSMVGWRHFGRAQPNAAHRALSRLEQQGRVDLLCTQNVDGLHQAAGSREVLDLHGRLDSARCMRCGHRQPREAIQAELEARNPAWHEATGAMRADGDIDLSGDFSDFVVPECPRCGGILKPDVVFFGEPVPRERVEAALASARRADAMLVVGSSLMVYSGYRFVEAAVAAGRPVAAVNLGRTRADAQLALKVVAPCDEVLPALLAQLGDPLLPRA